MTPVPLIALLLQSAPVTPETEALGRRLAATGGLATMIPLIVEKDLAELAGEDPKLTEAERARLVAIGRAEGRSGVDRLVGTLGRSYAERLSLADLRVLVAHAESAAAARLRAVEPATIMAAMGALGEIDLKKNTAAAFCRETKKLCDRD